MRTVRLFALVATFPPRMYAWMTEPSPLGVAAAITVHACNDVRHSQTTHQNATTG